MLRVFFNFSWTQFTFSYSYRLPWSSGLLISGTNSAGELWRTRSLQPRDRAGQEAIQPSPRSSSFEAGSWTAPAGYSAGSPRGTSSLWGFGFGGFGVFSFFQLKMPERSRTLAVPTSSAPPKSGGAEGHWNPILMQRTGCPKLGWGWGFAGWRGGDGDTVEVGVQHPQPLCICSCDGSAFLQSISSFVNCLWNGIMPLKLVLAGHKVILAKCRQLNGRCISAILWILCNADCYHNKL